jgi:isoquinoline 1-oxidoreductase beta subunit
MPVKLMRHRADEPREARLHPMATSRIRAVYGLGQVLCFEQRHTSVVTDFSHGLGEMISASVERLPAGLAGLGFSETVFTVTQELPYNFGVITQLLNETDARFKTGSMRSIYSQDVACANESFIDRLAARMGKDPLAFRLAFVRNNRVKGGAAEGGPGWELGQIDAGRNGARDCDPQRIQTGHCGSVAEVVEILRASATTRVGISPEYREP